MADQRQPHYRAQRPSAGLPKEPPLVDASWMAAHELRIREHAQRVDYELRALGLWPRLDTCCLRCSRLYASKEGGCPCQESLKALAENLV